MKRILVSGISKEMSGMVTFLIEMSRFMPNIVFDYIVEGDTCNYENEISHNKGVIYYVTERKKSVIGNIKDYYTLLKKLRKEYDTVYFNMASLTWTYPITCAINLNYKVLVHSHMGAIVSKDKIRRIVYIINKKRLKKKKVMRLTCSKKATEYMFYPDDEVIMIYNAVDLQKFIYNQDIRKKKREELKIERKKVIGFVGRLEEQKNPLFLIETVKDLSEKDDFILLMIGDGTLRDQIQEKIKEYDLFNKCLLLGTKKNVNEYLQAMDIFVLPSYHEGLPITAIEAQASGLHCILSDKITKETDVTGNVTFLPINKGTNWWTDEIRKRLDCKDKRRNMWGNQMCNTHFNIENEAIRLETILLKSTI